MHRHAFRGRTIETVGRIGRASRWAVGCTVLLVGLVPSSVDAGAPNYECQAGPNRIGIDQHRRAGLVRVGRGPVRPMPFVNEPDQNGDSLNMGAELPGGKGRISISGLGTNMTLTVGGRTHRGACAFVPGSFVLGHVSAHTVALRTDPDDASAVMTVLDRGSLVWSGGRFDEAANEMRGTDQWTQVRVVLTIRPGAASGGAQQLGMDHAAGMDGRSSVINGWSRVEGMTLLPNS